MRLYSWLGRFKFFSRLLHKDAEAEKFLEEKELLRTSLDDRLERIARATLNGEAEWFLTLARKDPQCAIRVIKECNIKDGT